MRIGTIAGFELRIHWSTLVIFGLLVWSLAAVQLPDQVPEASGAAYLVAGLAGGLAFYVALLAHEVSHAIVARRAGIEVHSLTLWLLGGVARLEGEPRTPGADLRIAGVGPAVSIAFGLAAAVAAVALDGAGAPGIVVATVGWLAGINLVIGVFNLMPAAPLDGGRILRGILWAWRGDRTQAAITAGRAGEVFGYLLVGLGLLSLFVPGVGGLWFVILGWFIITAARAEQSQTRLRDALSDVAVSAVMTRDPVTAPADLTVAGILDEYVLATRHSAFPLVGTDGRLAGLVTLNRLRSVPSGQRAATPVLDVACPIEDVVIARPSEDLVDLLPRLNECADGRALVVEDGRLLGIVTPTDVSRAVELSGFRTTPASGPRSIERDGRDRAPGSTDPWRGGVRENGPGERSRG